MAYGRKIATEVDVVNVVVEGIRVAYAKVAATSLTSPPTNGRRRVCDPVIRWCVAHREVIARKYALTLRQGAQSTIPSIRAYRAGFF